MFVLLRRGTATLGLCVGFVLAIFISPMMARAEFQVPALTGPVVDRAEILDGAAASSIESVLQSVRSRGGPQINVVTVPSLEGLPIESASIKITDAWKIGDQKRDDGVLFLVAPQDRKLRIEVGQGLEGVLTDVESKRIIEDQVLPYFRAGRMSDGVVVGVRAILEKTAPEQLKAMGDAPEAVRKKKRSRENSIPLPFFLLFLLFFFFIGGRRGRRSGLLGALAASSIGSGRGGWGGRGGGSSWGGGGGGFSGGGASGSW